MSIRSMFFPPRVGVKSPLARAPAAISWRAASSNPKSDNSKDSSTITSSKAKTPEPSSQPSTPRPKKTQAELDQELREKMSGLSGDGGESGIEYEDGQPTSMKRSVRNNMFRYI